MLEFIVAVLVIILAIIIGPDLLEKLDGSMGIFILVMSVIFVLPALLVGAYEEDHENSVRNGQDGQKEDEEEKRQ
jgi:uncharacterized membrane protein